MLRVCVCMCMLSCAWLFAIPWTVVCQVPLSIEFSGQEYWSGFPFPIPRDLPNPGIKPESPLLVRGLLSSVAPGNPPVLSGSIINIMFLSLVLMLIPFFSNYVCSWLNCSPAVNSMGVLLTRILTQLFWRGNPQIVWLFVDGQIGVATWLLLSGHVTTTGQQEAPGQVSATRRVTPKTPGWWGKLLTVAATQRQVSGWALPPRSVLAFGVQEGPQCQHQWPPWRTLGSSLAAQSSWVTVLSLSQILQPFFPFWELPRDFENSSLLPRDFENSFTE